MTTASSLVGVLVSAALAAISLGYPRLAAAQKTDLIFLTNGDQITGEIKELQRGKLKLSTNAMGTIFIEYPHIEHVVTDKDFEVELSSGEKYFGAIERAAEPGMFKITGPAETSYVSKPEIVRVTRIRRKFWKRVDAKIDLGFTTAQANSLVQWNLDASASYRTRKYKASTSLNTFLSDQTGADTIARSDLDFTYQRFLRNRLSVAGYLAFEQNNELGLDLRATLAGGAGRFWIQTNKSLLNSVLGLALNREDYVGSPETTTLELLMGVKYQFFTYDDPDTDITTSFNVFPSLSDWGRIRTQFEASLSRDLIGDFYWRLSLNFTTDSDPPTAGLPSSDGTFTTSFGYSW